MPKPYVEPQAFEQDPRPPVTLQPVESNQVAAIGYDEATKTLAVTFKRGVGAIYHYPGVEKDVHAAFVNAESIGTFFGQNIKALPFKKYPAEPQAEAVAA